MEGPVQAPAGGGLRDGTEPAEADRLDSWKEIAAFLHRDVRTAQRWEKVAGLPVHRHATSRLRTAYAYRSELEAWWSAQPAALTGAAPKEAAPDDRRAWIGHAWIGRAWTGRAALAAGLLAALAALAMSVLPWGAPARASNAALPAPQAVPVLLAPTIDQGADPRLASLLDEILTRRLTRERHIQVVAPARVTRMLRLMRREPDLRIPLAVAREVAVRDGDIRFVLAGRLHKLPTRFIVGFELIEPADGRVRASLEQQAANPEDLLAAVRRTAAELASLLVAAARERTLPAERLEHVTTASLPALRLYTAAVQAGARGEWSASELLAHRAVETDDRFAAAQAWVGRAMRNQGRSAHESLPFARRALALAAGTTDREVYVATGLFHDLDGNLPGALAAHEALLRLYPRDRFGLELLMRDYARAGRLKEAAGLAVSRATLEPGDWLANLQAARAVAIWQEDWERAASFLQRAQELASPDALADRPRWAAWMRMLPVFRSWLAGDIGEAVEQLLHLERGLDDHLGRERDAYATAVGFANLALGRVQAAEHAFRRASMPARQINLAMLALALDDEPRARGWLSQIRSHSRERPALFASAGLTVDAERGLASALATEHGDGTAAVTRGIILARRGEVDAAIASLRRGTELLRFSGEPEFFLGIEVLAGLWARRGNADHAVRLLADAAGEQGRTCGTAHAAAAYWIRLNARLRDAYQRQGRLEEAGRVDAALRSVLRRADARHPYVRTIGRPASSERRLSAATLPASRTAR